MCKISASTCTTRKLCPHPQVMQSALTVLHMQCEQFWSVKAEVCEASEESLVQRGGQSPLQELSAAQQRARVRLRARQEGRLLESADGVAEAFAGQVSLGGPRAVFPAAYASPTGLACFQPASNLQPTTVNPKAPPFPGRHDSATAFLGRDPLRALHGGRGAAHRNTGLAQRAPSGAVPRPQEIKPKALAMALAISSATVIASATSRSYVNMHWSTESEFGAWCMGRTWQ
mmetsp:Transcript_148581/g.475716  ORF Transcript_148581/g.475716 Transcript_148581/m.475716 type:complete len:230 (-) Transcript_148581:435-1124(-)